MVPPLPNYYKINYFNNFLSSCGLTDLGYIGSPFTWINGRGTIHNIKTRIDRAHANADWVSLFPDTKIYHLPRIYSDHCPILIKTDTTLIRGPKPFRFESMWMSHRDFHGLVTSA